MPEALHARGFTVLASEVASNWTEGVPGVCCWALGEEPLRGEGMLWEYLTVSKGSIFQLFPTSSLQDPRRAWPSPCLVVEADLGVKRALKKRSKGRKHKGAECELGARLCACTGLAP